MIGLLITTYNRPEYLQQCFDSIKSITLPNQQLYILIIDDFSSDEKTINLIKSFYIDSVPIIKIFKTKNGGIKESLKIGFEYLIYNLRCETLINLDSDAIVKPEFINRLIDLKSRFHNNIISGFNSKNKTNGQLRNPIIEEHNDYYLKKYCNGINMCFYADTQYANTILPALEKIDGNWDFDTHKKENGFIISKPSLVEHIGIKSSMGHTELPDVAFDFTQKELILENVTLFGIDAYNPNGILRASDICQKNIQFGDVKIITERLFNGREGYSKFCILDMYKYIETSHVLIIHPDGYIQNYNAWDESWLQYDYIGATWDWYNEYQNGNGGFSLRSKKLLDILSKFDLPEYHPEDDIICRKLRPKLESEYGIKFAPVEICKKFSIEGYGLRPEFRRYNGEFGFHGYFISDLPIPPMPRQTENKKQRK